MGERSRQKMADAQKRQCPGREASPAKKEAASSQKRDSKDMTVPFLARKVGYAEIILGNRAVFMPFKSTWSLEKLKKSAIICTASMLNPSFTSLGRREIVLDEYKELRFYLLDRDGRSICLRNMDDQFTSILAFFDYKLTLKLELDVD